MSVNPDDIEVGLCKVSKERSEIETLGVSLKNISDEPIEGLVPTFNWVNETPQPGERKGITVAEGGTFMQPVGGQYVGSIEPGETITFFLQPDYFRSQVLRRIASLSPERYEIQILDSNAELVKRIDGVDIGAAIDDAGF